MNLRLALTKGTSEIKPSIADVIDKGEERASFYSGLLEKNRAEWEREGTAYSSYSQFLSNYYRSVEGRSPIESFMVKTTSPLIIGNGGQSVLETHLALHAIYGVPYLPGTAIKGVAAHYCHRYLGTVDDRFLENGSYYQVLFGSKDVAANIIYYDAYPEADHISNMLELDVLTPHHQEYYQSGQSAGNAAGRAPREDDSPIPFSFLSVQGSFRIALGWLADHEDTQTEQWLKVARRVVVGALEQAGIGGKINAGYGRMMAEGEEGY